MERKNEQSMVKEVFPLRRKDLEKIRNYFKENDKIVILSLLNVGLNSALRYSDLHKLKFEDISKENIVILKERKTGKNKYLKLNRNCMEQLKSLQFFYLKLGIEKYNTGFIFKSLNREYVLKGIDSPIKIQSFNRYLKKASKALGINYNIASHSMRKTWGKFYFEEKNDIATVMKILNHSSMQSTLRYIGIEKERILEVYENFNI